MQARPTTFHSMTSDFATTLCDQVGSQLPKVVVLLIVMSSLCSAAPSDDFVTTWKTDNPGSSNDTSITVPMIGGPYDVDWNGDGVFDQLGLFGEVSHNFGVAGTYTIRIQGTYDAIQIDYGGDRNKIVDVAQWGTNTWKTMDHAFAGAENLVVSAVDAPDLSAVANMSSMFSAASNANPNTSSWDTSSVTNMRAMFSDTLVANPDTRNWNTGAVTDMEFMFFHAAVADPDTSGWDTHNVTNMGYMFFSASMANPDTTRWDTRAVTTMAGMFYDAVIADPDTSGWDTSEVTNMRGMFSGATMANPDISGWSTGSVTDTELMFWGATSFDGDLSGWNVSGLREAKSMFENGAGISTSNYEALLTSWSAQTLQPGVIFDGGTSQYCAHAAAAARASMIINNGWTINDNGRCAESIFSDSFDGIVVAASSATKKGATTTNSDVSIGPQGTSGPLPIPTLHPLGAFIMILTIVASYRAARARGST